MKKLLLSGIALIFLLSLCGQQERDNIEDRYKWDLTDIYPSDEAWKEAKTSLSEKMEKIDEFKGTLTQSAGQLLDALEYTSEVTKEAVKLYIYTSMHSDLDTRDMKYLGMKQEMQQILSGYSARASYVDPEILTADWATIEGFINQEPGLAPYEKSLKDLFRMKAHTPGEAEGRIIALSGMVAGVPSSVYNTFKNAEMPNPKVTLSTGETVTLDSPGYEKYRVLPNREDRELVFRSFFENLGDFQATMGELLYGGVKRDVYMAKAHKYNTSLEAALDPNNIPVEVYHALVENVNKNLPTFQRYLKIKQRMLGVDTLRYIDLYAPVVKEVDLSYSFDEAKDIILKALAPLGKDYVNTIQKAFDNRWIDVYPSPGKKSGAYSNGAFYDGHPFILLNFNDLYEDVSTAAHELGHTMQSYYSNKNQPYPTSDYPIFVAEVASTFNEALLFDHIIKDIKDDEVKLTLLMNRLDGFKGTLFRQTQFAEFELKMHEAVEQGTPLTGAYLSDLYDEIVKKYYGHDQGICVVDDFINMEWAFIPHFYYDFYVYQYSTSFTASISLARSVMEGEEGARERYIEFLSAGGSEDPIDLIRDAGVDMTGPEAFDSSIAEMNELMDQIEVILDRKDL